MQRFPIVFPLIITLLFSIYLCSCNTRSKQEYKDGIIASSKNLCYNLDLKELNRTLYKSIQENLCLKAFYESDSCGLLFFDESIKQNELSKVLNILSEVEHHGLDPEMFNISQIQALASDIDSGYIEAGSIKENIVALDNMATQAVIDYITGMNYGFLLPDSLFSVEDYAITNLRPDSIFFAQLYTQIRKDVVVAMNSSLPTDSIYKAMLESYNYWNSKKDNKPTEIELKNQNLQYLIGDKHKNINAIAKRLMWTGEFSPDSTYTDTLYQTLTKSLLKAVNNFRETNSYPYNDKEVDNLTLKALNRGADHYLKKLAANMERYRWKHDQKAKSKHIEVNVASFKLFATQKNSLPIIMKICVGKNNHKTPLLQSNIAYLNLNPIWNVPKSIAKNEIFPSQRKDTSYFRKHNMRLYKDGREVDFRKINWKQERISERSYFIRQDAGPYNSLGRIKFMFNNKFSVYLHDTPAQMPFNKKDRAVSHGCIRLQRPIDLALFCLSPTSDLYRDELLYSIDKEPNTKEGKNLLAQKKLEKLEDIIRFDNKEKVSLTIDYYTVFMYPNNKKLYYADDVYGYDDIIYYALKDWGIYNKVKKTNKNKNELY